MCGNVWLGKVLVFVCRGASNDKVYVAAQDLEFEAEPSIL